MLLADRPPNRLGADAGAVLDATYLIDLCPDILSPLGRIDVLLCIEVLD